MMHGETQCQKPGVSLSFCLCGTRYQKPGVSLSFCLCGTRYDESSNSTLRAQLWSCSRGSLS